MSCTIDYQYMRPKKAAVLKKWHEKPFHCRKELMVDTFQNSVILPLRQFPGDTLSWGRGGMLDEKGNYIPQSSIFTFYDFGYSVENEEYRDEKVVYGGFFAHHWGHFLLDTVPRLWYWFENDQTIDKYVFMVYQDESTELTGNYREFFSLLGILDKVEIISQPTRYREVVVPELSYDRRKDYWSRRYNQIFEAVSANMKPEPQWETREKIYLSRGRLEKALRMEAGLDFLDHYFRKNGFEVVYPEAISLSYMIFLIQNADLVAAESGSLPHNMLFGEDGKKIVIVERYAFNDREQPDVNIIKDMNVVYIDGCLGLYPVELSYGPFMFCYDTQFERFTRDYGFLPPDEKYTSAAYRKKVFQQYFAAYTDEHRYQWYMGEWMLPHADSLYEIYEDSMAYFGDYMKGKRPFLWHHYFEIHYFKQFVKRLIGWERS